ncbi:MULTISPECIES: DUF2065 domain-containing protein [unclassified Thalassotalea]|uniref:DUF2065 domain-containing protein n=1 Tax=unclassified Thalassotalea TaxID=2614972 RepID=UPI001081B4BC|nr:MULTISPECIES: DUF2065 domain-containing protein [unclassified Thalassotalea]NMP17029.1 DUF2065 domain-containing protein [Thalassotalea sp. Y01]QBY04661.1 DUF2065 domain-containing protein [Thalassotalea sp. HSM 43]
MTIEIVLIAFALMLMFEGLGPLLFPNRWRNFMMQLAKEKPTTIRQIGLVLVTIGAVLFMANY